MIPSRLGIFGWKEADEPVAPAVGSLFQPACSPQAQTLLNPGTRSRAADGAWNFSPDFQVLGVVWVLWGWCLFADLDFAAWKARFPGVPRHRFAACGGQVVPVSRLGVVGTGEAGSAPHLERTCKPKQGRQQGPATAVEQG